MTTDGQARFEPGDRVRIKYPYQAKGVEVTVVGPATQDGMDIVVEWSHGDLAEFRNWEVERV